MVGRGGVHRIRRLDRGLLGLHRSLTSHAWISPEHRGKSYRTMTPLLQTVFTRFNPTPGLVLFLVLRVIFRYLSSDSHRAHAALLDLPHLFNHYAVRS
jgi:hypothetical protein